MKESNTSSNRQHFKALKKLGQQKLRQAYWNYIENIISPALSEDSKIFWSFIKAQRTDSVGVSPLKADGKLVSDSTGKADILNKQNKSVFSIEPDVMPLYQIFRIDIDTLECPKL